MDILDYRRYVLNSYEGGDDGWGEAILELQTSEVEKYRWLWTHPARMPRYRSHHKNHPLVNSRDAFWKNNTSLCVGYKLNSNNTIFRPIFSHRRQDLINNFQENIKKTVLKREEMAAWYEFVRIKRLPIDIVDKIIEYRGGSLAVVLGLKS